MLLAHVQVASQAEDLKKTHANIKEGQRNLELLERSLHETRLQILSQVEANKLLQLEGQDLNEKLVSSWSCYGSI